MVVVVVVIAVVVVAVVAGVRRSLRLIRVGRVMGNWPAVARASLPPGIRMLREELRDQEWERRVLR